MLVALQNRSITTHIILVSVFLALAPLLTLSWYANYQKTKDVQEMQLQHMERLLDEIIEHTDSKVRQYMNLATSLSSSPFLVQFLQNQTEKEKVREFLKKHKNTHLYHQIYLIKNSKIIATSASSQEMPSFDLKDPLLAQTSLASAVQKATQSKHVLISDLAYFGPSNSPTAFITAPIFDKDEVVGSVAIELSESFFFDLIRSNIGFGKTGELVAAKLRSDGAIVATIPLKHSLDAFHNQQILHENAQQEGLPQAAQGEYGSGIVVDYRNEEVLSTWGYIPLLDWGVQIKIDSKEIYANIWQSNQAFFLFFLGVGAMIFVIVFFSTRFITRPLLHLSDSIKRFGEGEHIKALPGSSLEITQLAHAFNLMEDKINSHLQELQSQAKTIEEHNQTLEAQIQERTKSLQESHQQITALLNNSGQGFLSIGPSLHVRPEYSKECEVLLGSAVSQKHLPELLFANPQEQESFQKTLSLYFNATDSLQKEAYLSLLDSEINIGGFNISIEYKPIDEKTLMLILTDISRLCELEQEIQEERTLLNAITMALKDKRQFFDAIESYKNEIQTYQDYIKSTGLDKQKLQTLYRKIHTYKGVFLQYALPNIPKALHILEEDISHKLEDSSVDFSLNEDYFNNVQKALEADLELLSRYLGKDFIEQKDAFTISQTQYDLLEQHIHMLENRIGDGDPLIIETKKLLSAVRLTPLRNLMAAYPQLAFQLAIQMDKEIESFDIDGGDFLVDPHQYGDFAKALIHLFNNAIDHGIEAPWEREDIGKSPVGKLSCTISQSPGFFHIQLSDDGRGLDAEKIRQKALQRGLKIPSDSSDEEIFLLIFEDGFSLKDVATQISGRGVGLGALKAETQALGGTLEVTSFLHKGSTFSFNIPFRNEKDFNEV